MKLLLAEDEQSLSKALTAILEHNGYTVDALRYTGSQSDALNTNFIMYITVSASNTASYKYRPQSTSRTDPYQSQYSFA